MKFNHSLATKLIVMCICTFVSFQSLYSQITGTVFRDYNANGTKQTTASYNEPGVPNVIVKAYNAIDAVISTATTSATGTYSLSGLGNSTPYRIEFTFPNTGCGSSNKGIDFGSYLGATYGTSVQFITTSPTGTGSANYALNNPGDYVNPATTNPAIFTSVFTNGALTFGSTPGRINGLKLQYNAAAAAVSPTPASNNTQITTHADMGSVWGVAYSRQATRLFYSAVLKRHAGLGNGIGAAQAEKATGAIYVTDPNTTTGATAFIDLDNAGFPTRGAGTYPYTTAPIGRAATNTVPLAAEIGTNTQRGLPVAATAAAYSGAAVDQSYDSYDAAALAQAGKVGLGGLDISDDGKTMYVMNLFDRKLYVIPINGYNTTTPTAGTPVGFAVPNPGYTGGTYRPWAVKYYRGRVYVGMVNDLSSASFINGTTAGVYANAKGSIYTFDPSTNGFTLLTDVPLNYIKKSPAGELTAASTAGGNGNYEHVLRYNPWNDNYDNFKQDNTIGNQKLTFPQPILSDIEFDNNGSVIVGIMDRLGLQVNYRTWSPSDKAGDEALIGGNSAQNGRSEVASGDVLRIGLNGATCVLTNESNGNDGNNTTSGVGDGEGPGGGQYYNGESYAPGGLVANANSPQHVEVASGGLTMLRGDSVVLTNAFDPSTLVNAGGVLAMSNKTGDTPNDGTTYFGANIYDGNTRGVTSAKGVGMGDIELFTEAAPLEIGNRVWNDANSDGIQEAGEAGIANVTLELFADFNNDGIPDGAALASTTTASAGDIGSWYFNNANVTDGDPTTAGNQAGLKAGAGYIVRVAASDWAGGVGVGDLAGLGVTKTDKIGNGEIDLSDNDAVLTVSATPVPQIRLVAGNSGENNHTLDFGFKSTASIGNRVWRDDNKDGIQNETSAGSGLYTEPGVAGVTVTLYQNGVVLATTVTDAYGNYLFDNLTPTTTVATMYSVGFTLPTNYQFTTQTNTQVTGTSDITNTTTVTGGSTALNGSDANVTTGRTGAFWLAPGEAERGVDAGIIINTPATPSSIGDRVWMDLNSDGIQNETFPGSGIYTEPGVAGVTVTLYKETTPGSGVYTPYATTVTDVNGNYLFNNLPNNTNYKVGITPPVGTLLTVSTGGTTPGNATTNSDLDPTTRLSAVVNIPPAGAQITGIDAGLILQSTTKACLGDRVWYDNNRDGVQDAGEPGIAGVTVNLLNASDVVIATTTTDAFGNYIFPDLNPGGYRVQFAAVAGMQRTLGNSTSGNIPDATDSDADQATGRTQGYILVAGEKNMSVDAGYYSTQPAANVGALGDRVWNDLNGDGIQNETTPGSGIYTEPGVAGITVTLYNSAGTAIATTTTDANGNYLFPGLTPGNYSVGFSNLPVGFSFTGQDKGASDAVDSDVNPGTGRTALAAVVGGATNSSVDAGIRQGIPSGLGSLGNKVWWDVVNANNIQDPGEVGVVGVTVNLYFDSNGDGVITGAEATTAVATTTTNALGEYMFTGLAAGTYQVGFTNLPLGSSTVTQDSGADDTVDSDGSAVANATALSVSTTGLYTLAAGEDNLTVDLGIRNTAKGSFGNRVWYDNGLGGGTASNGIQDGTEIGTAGVTVTLVNAAGQPVDRTGTVTTNPITTTTDANGYYSFADLTAGAVFAARFTNIPAGFDFTSKVGVGSGDDNRSDADILSGLTPAVTIVANTHNTTLDAGLIGTRAALGNRVWNDLNNDGVQDETSPGSGIYTEPGVAGVTVTLFRPGFGLDGIAGTADDALPVASMITDAAGAYFFGNLIPGDYQVEFTTIPTGMIFTQQNTPGDNQNNTNSDAIPANTNGRTGTITLSAGEVDLTIDAGLTVPRPATIGNKVWADFDTDGIQDTNEPGIGGVVVTLYNSSNQPIGTAVTDGNGNWQITNVPTGTGYYVIFSPNLPAFDVSGAPGTNPAWTAQNQGGAIATQALDSGTESDVDSDVTVSGANAGRTGTFSIVPGNNFPNIDAGIINWPAQNILPIRLISFVANPKASTVELAWVVATETNVANYEVEYSANGTNYTSIGSKTAMGSRNYTLIHTSPKQGLNYYRLKIIDRDGKVSYSEVRTVNFGAVDGTVKLYPIPAVSTVNITLTSGMINQAATISIISVDGRLVYQQTTTALSQTETINVSKLANGKYIVRIVTNNQVVNTIMEILR
jgi:hypothetical protein